MSVVDAPLSLPAKKFQSDGKAHKTNLKALEEFAQVIYGQLVPVGVIAPYAGVTAPTGWILCDGAAVSRTTYYTLYTIIGTQYGAGDGSTTFNVPNLKAAGAADMRVPVGAGTGVTQGTTTGTILSNAATAQGKGVAVNFIIKA